MADRGRRRRALAATAALLVAFATAMPSAATPGNTSGFELTRGTQRALHRIQEAWLQWVSAFYRDNETRAAESLTALEANVRQLGMTRIVDVSLGAAAMAVQSAREGKFERAEWALTAAERLDPDRPESAFARAEVERLSGHRWSSWMSSIRGMARLARSDERIFLVSNLLFWSIAVLMMAGALFVLVEVAAKGSAVIADLRRWLSARLGPGMAWFCTVVLLLWPLLLPGGPIWLMLYWSALLWGYEGVSERWVTVAIWGLVAAGPWFVAATEQRLAIATSPPMRALAHFAERRLYGGLLGDLDVLQTVLGDQPAAQELLGDAHRVLGQWEQARNRYRAVQAAEPENVQVLVNLGAYHFRKSDFALANSYFEQAAKIQPPSVAALYDLSLSFAETYQFEESQRAIAQARAIDDDQVNEWVKQANPGRVFTFDGGLERRDEIRRELAAVWSSNPPGEVAGITMPERASFYAVLVVAALAVGLHLARRGKPYAEPTPWLAWRSGPVSRWLRAFLPALSQVELGEGGRAAVSLIALSSILLAPRLFSFGFEVPVLFGVPAWLPWILGLLGMAAYLALCVRAEMAEGE
ncbi:MAG: tetratricopeptide repeat protein [Thermoanaerobaculia bacterium]